MKITGTCSSPATQHTTPNQVSLAVLLMLAMCEFRDIVQTRPGASWVTEEHFGFPRRMPCTRMRNSPTIHVSASVSLPYPQHLNLSECDAPSTESLLLFPVGDAHSHSSPSTPLQPRCRVQKKLKGLVSGSNLWLFSLST